MTEQIKIAHGGGGTLMQQLITEEFLPLLRPGSDFHDLADSARLPINASHIAFTSDSFVVQPLFFPGGDIGKLAVCGTVNDLAARGAVPQALSLSLIIEEGFPLDDLRKIIKSIAQTAQQAQVTIVTGDTKVVERGAASGIFINTAGVGAMPANLDFNLSRIQPDDVLIINGPLGDHGTAVMSVRKGLNFASQVTSDVAPLNHLVKELIDTCGDKVKCMTDLTRGGLAANLNELARSVGFIIDETKIPVRPAVRGACDMLGLDVLTVANEGKMLFVVSPAAVEQALAILKNNPLGTQSAPIGTADNKAGRVRIKTQIGGERIVDTPYGEELPRIC